MISTTDLAQILVDHHNCNPEDAELCAGLIIDHSDQQKERPLVDLVEQSKSAYPMFYRKAEPPAASAPVPSTLSITEQVARAAKQGATVPNDEVMKALNAMRGRAF